MTMRIKVVLTLVLVQLYHVQSLQTTPKSKKITIFPSQVEFRNVCQQYPETIARRLFSSVPRREYALHDISFTLNSEFVLLTGASSSGKSTILRLLSGKEQPSKGSINITSCNPNDNNDDPSQAAGSSVVPTAQPVYLHERPTFDTSRAIHQILQDHSTSRNLSPGIASQLVQQFCTTFELNATSERWMDQRTSSLTPSECYRLELILACLKSSLANYDSSGHPGLIPAPILLLDEWMDKETSTIIQTVQQGLLQATKQGAVILSVTHKPERWKTTSSSLMTLCRGEILSFHR